MRPTRFLLFLLALLPSCTAVPFGTDVQIRATLPPRTRAQNPDETLISDLNVFIFSESGQLEEKRFIPSRRLEKEGDDAVFRTRLFEEGRYSIYVCANLGYDPRIRNLDELLSFRYHFTYPDEYGKGMPMTGCLLRVRPSDHGGTLTVPLERLMAKITLRLDRSALRKDVRMRVHRVRIGACPSSALLFGESRAEKEDDLFLNGFSREGRETDALNRNLSGGLSMESDLYLLENLQGTERSGLCSYIELEIEYHSDMFHSPPGEYLIYRFFCGPEDRDFDLRRNTWYRYTVRPVGDGLDGDGWRIDRSRLEPEGETFFDLHPAAFNKIYEKKPFHLWCEIWPENAPVEIEPLAYDDTESVSEVYDYQIDVDGKGIVLTPRKAGTALVYFKAGPPVGKDTLAMVVFNL